MNNKNEKVNLREVMKSAVPEVAEGMGYASAAKLLFVGMIGGGALLIHGFSAGDNATVAWGVAVLAVTGLIFYRLFGQDERPLLAPSERIKAEAGHSQPLQMFLLRTRRISLTTEYAETVASRVLCDTAFEWHEVEGAVQIIGSFGTLVMRASNKPLYDRKNDFAARLPYENAAAAMRQHKAGLFVSLVAPEGADVQIGLNLLTAMTARLADEDTCGVVYMNGDIVRAVSGSGWTEVRDAKSPFQELMKAPSRSG